MQVGSFKKFFHILYGAGCAELEWVGDAREHVKGRWSAAQNRCLMPLKMGRDERQCP